MSNEKQYVIGLTGFARSGKSTVAEHLVKLYGFVHISFADTLRDLCSAVNPMIGIKPGWWTPVYYNDALAEVGYNEAKAKYPEFRRFLQRMGTEGGRKILSDTIWVDKWEEKVKAALLEGKSVVASDVRFLNEAEAIRGIHFNRSHAGGEPFPLKEVWRINRDGVGPQADHSSELQQLEIEVDRTIENTELNELGGKASKALQDLIDDDYARGLVLLREIQQLAKERKAGFIKYGEN